MMRANDSLMFDTPLLQFQNGHEFRGLEFSTVFQLSRPAPRFLLSGSASINREIGSNPMFASFRRRARAAAAALVP
jgi:hypothetical protein